ncbi:MAG TPA: class I SAM-dependent methyltransferase [Gaiellaceae bacterium]|nr:class I SAM-dependent methyltransferase [Gaiellaceae bacterium]
MTDVGLERHKEDWERLAEVDAMWAVLTAPDQRGGGWDADAFFATGAAEIEQVLSSVNDLRPLAYGRALDFGCGVGRLTRALAARFETAVGVDISAGMVETARALNGDVDSCEFRVNTSTDLSQFGDGEFDFVYSSLVLQHLPSRELVRGYVAEFLRVAAPDGLVAFGLPARISWPYRLALSRRAYGALRRLGVGEQTMLRRTRLTPMRMRAVPEADVRVFLDGRGATVLRAELRDAGSVRTVRYYVSPGRG